MAWCTTAPLPEVFCHTAVSFEHYYVSHTFQFRNDSIRMLIKAGIDYWVDFVSQEQG